MAAEQNQRLYKAAAYTRGIPCHEGYIMGKVLSRQAIQIYCWYTHSAFQDCVTEGCQRWRCGTGASIHSHIGLPLAQDRKSLPKNIPS